MDVFKYQEVDDEHVNNIRDNSVTDDKTQGRVVVTPSNCFLNAAYQEYCQRIYEFEVYPDDVWVVTFPKCGTTWTQEMVWLLQNNLDYKAAAEKPITSRFPFIEIEALMKMSTDIETIAKFPSSIEESKNLPRPRTIKSHLPLELLPKQLWTVKPKIIYVARDPKDAAVSFYYHHRMMMGYIGSFENFIKAFLAERIIYAPYWSHVLNFWKLRDEPYIMFNTYEEMKKDLPGVIKKTAAFLGKELNQEELDKLTNHLSFQSMRNNPSVNYDFWINMTKEKTNVKEDLHFIRKGQVGAWKTELTQDLIDRFEEWTKENLKGTEFTKYPWS